MGDGGIKVDPRNETKRARALWGTSRSMVNNLVTGVSKGFERKLEITGVGYKAAVQGKNLQLSLGFSHDVIFPIPEGIAIAPPSRRRSRSAASTNVGRTGRRRNSRLASARTL